MIISCVSCCKGGVSENAEMQIIISYNCWNRRLLTRHFFAKIISTLFMLENFFHVQNERVCQNKAS